MFHADIHLSSSLYKLLYHHVPLAPLIIYKKIKSGIVSGNLHSKQITQEILLSMRQLS